MGRIPRRFRDRGTRNDYVRYANRHRQTRFSVRNTGLQRERRHRTSESHQALTHPRRRFTHPTVASLNQMEQRQRFIYRISRTTEKHINNPLVNHNNISQ